MAQTFSFSDQASMVRRTWLGDYWYDEASDVLDGSQLFSATWKLKDNAEPTSALIAHIGQIHYQKFASTVNASPGSREAALFEIGKMGLRGLPSIALQQHHYDDRKPWTPGTGGERRSLTYGVNLVDIIQDMRTLCAQRWTSEQFLRPYAREVPGTYPPSEGQRVIGYDGVGRSIDDDQHMQFAHSFFAAAWGQPVGWFAVANGLQHWINAWSMGAGSSERQKFHYLMLASRAALLGFGEGIGRTWANVFCKGMSAKEWLVELLTTIWEGRNEFHLYGQYKEYKLPRLHNWPIVITYAPQFDLPEIASTTQPSNMGEYAWQWGMKALGIWYALLVIKYLDIDFPLKNEMRKYGEWISLWINSTSIGGPTPMIMGGSWYNWTEQDADKILAQYAFEQPSNWQNINKHHIGNGRYILGRTWQGWNKEQAVWAATGASMFSATDNMTNLLQQVIDNGHYEDRVDIMAPAINHLNLNT